MWVCLGNEYNIRTPKWTEAEMAAFGRTIRSYLPYPTPLSVHASPPVVWADAFDSLPAWNDHQIVQKKLKRIAPAADVMGVASGAATGHPRNKPTVNDELSYQGAGDKHTESDTVEALLGAFLGGGYASTGYKPGNKLGHYFWGGFDPAEHTAAGHLLYLRRVIDREVAFWKMAPDLGIFENLDPGFRGMAWRGREYVLGTDAARRGLVARLPEGTWKVTRHDVTAEQSVVLNESASGAFTFDSPDARAVLFHFKRN